ncbi:signal peptidase I [Bacillus sp. FJAT-27445]|uniref:signal peptidase I n=1 Tax=Bacillus sp. FJAT-27445 TaxID=1679166 RepID=UPI0007436407|nr:signal peptidase I [Bacillus sp. FJAT-27445]
MEKDLRNLRKAMNSSTLKGVHFSELQKEKIRNSLRQEVKNANIKPSLHPYLITALAASLFLLLFYQDINKSFFGGPNHGAEETIQDNITKPEIDLVKEGSNTFIIEYGSDNMDRGNHDFQSIDGLRKTVIERTNQFQRGTIVYYKYPGDNILVNPPDYYMGRVVGLPGETVEIIDGQVYIDSKKLEAFYAKKRRGGLDMAAYLAKKLPHSYINEEDFKEDMPSIKIPDSAIFVLSDDWFRGTGSQDFGPLDISAIEGRVLGYLKEDKNRVRQLEKLSRGQIIEIVESINPYALKPAMTAEERYQLRQQIYKNLTQDEIATVNEQIVTSSQLLTGLVADDLYRNLIDQKDKKWSVLEGSECYQVPEKLNKVAKLVLYPPLQDDLNTVMKLCKEGVEERNVLKIIDAKRILQDLSNHLIDVPYTGPGEGEVDYGDKHDQYFKATKTLEGSHSLISD